MTIYQASQEDGQFSALVYVLCIDGLEIVGVFTTIALERMQITEYRLKLESQAFDMWTEFSCDDIHR